MLWSPLDPEKAMLPGAPPPPPFSLEHLFAHACGLRRNELLNLCVRDIHRDEKSLWWIRVLKGRRLDREVPILSKDECLVLHFVENARLFVELPSAISVRFARRQYAQRLYYHLRNPHSSSRVDVDAVRVVMQALGLSNQAFVLRNYLGLHEDPDSQIATE